jgi:hypothetical protein
VRQMRPLSGVCASVCHRVSAWCARVRIALRAQPLAAIVGGSACWRWETPGPCRAPEGAAGRKGARGAGGDAGTAPVRLWRCVAVYCFRGTCQWLPVQVLASVFLLNVLAFPGCVCVCVCVFSFAAIELCAFGSCGVLPWGAKCGGRRPGSLTRGDATPVVAQTVGPKQACLGPVLGSSCEVHAGFPAPGWGRGCSVVPSRQ